MRYRRAVLALLAVVLAAGCQVQTVVTVTVEDDGSGTVSVAAQLDPEAVAELPDLDGNGISDAADLTKLVRVEDLQAAGWKVASKALKDQEGQPAGAQLTVTKRFGTPDEAEKILAELSAPSAGFRDLKISRKSSFALTKYSFSGMVDLSGGLEAFGDEDLAKVLEGEPLGQDAAEIEQRYGKPLDQLMRLVVRVELPGGKKEVWQPKLGGDPVQMSASSSVRDRIVLGLGVLSLSCLIALAVVLLTRRRSTS